MGGVFGFSRRLTFSLSSLETLDREEIWSPRIVEFFLFTLPFSVKSLKTSTRSSKLVCLVGLFSARLAAWITRFLAISKASSIEVAFGVFPTVGYLGTAPINGEKLLLVLVWVGLGGSSGCLLGHGVGASSAISISGLLSISRLLVPLRSFKASLFLLFLLF